MVLTISECLLEIRLKTARLVGSAKNTVNISPAEGYDFSLQ